MIKWIFSIIFFSLIITISSVSAYDSVYEVFWAGCCFIYLLFFIIWIILGIWVYNDAKERGENGALWLIIVLVLGIIGLIIWLLVRPKTVLIEAKSQILQPDRRCPNCGRIIPFDAKICPYCGKKFIDNI